LKIISLVLRTPANAEYVIEKNSELKSCSLLRDVSRSNNPHYATLSSKHKTQAAGDLPGNTMRLITGDKNAKDCSNHSRLGPDRRVCGTNGRGCAAAPFS
jgi:hypothetical protein